MIIRERNVRILKLALLDCVVCVGADTSFEIGCASNFFLQPKGSCYLNKAKRVFVTEKWPNLGAKFRTSLRISLMIVS